LLPRFCWNEASSAWMNC